MTKKGFRKRVIADSLSYVLAIGLSLNITHCTQYVLCV